MRDGLSAYRCEWPDTLSCGLVPEGVDMSEELLDVIHLRELSYQPSARLSRMTDGRPFG
jgi:hypothetical protein